MKTELEILIEQNPNLIYDSGNFFENKQDWDDDAPMCVSPESHAVLNADLIIEDFYEGKDGLINPQEKDPTKQSYKPVSGAEFIKQEFGGNYNKAFQNLK